MRGLPPRYKSPPMVCEICSAPLDPDDHYRFAMDVYHAGDAVDEPSSHGRLCHEHGEHLAKMVYEFAVKAGLTATHQDREGGHYNPGRHYDDQD